MPYYAATSYRDNMFANIIKRVPWLPIGVYLYTMSK